MSRCQKLPVWRRPQRCQISCPSFPNHRASNHPSLRLQAWRWSKQKACHQYLSVSAITTIQAPYMLQQSCASLVLACQFGIGIVHSSQNIDRRIWPAQMRWIPPAQSRSLSSYLIPYFSPIRFSPYISCLGGQQRMSWPHAAQASMQGWPPRLIFCHLLVWSPNHGWWWLVLAWFCIWSTTANVFTHSCMLAWNSILIQNLAFYLIDCFSTFKILNLYMYIIRNLYELFG